MNLYGQAHLAKQLNDQQNSENYWRIFRELEEAKKTIDILKAENKKLKDNTKPIKLKKASTKKKSAGKVVEEATS